jgi:hypothetical protein
VIILFWLFLRYATVQLTGNFIGGDATDEGYKYTPPGKIDIIYKLLFQKHYQNIKQQ